VTHRCQIWQLSIPRQHFTRGGFFESLRAHTIVDPETGQPRLELSDIRKAALVLVMHALERYLPTQIEGEPAFFLVAEQGVSKYEVDPESGIAASEDWQLVGLDRNLFRGFVHFSSKEAQPMLMLPDITAYAWLWLQREFGASANSEEPGFYVPALTAQLEGHDATLQAFLRRAGNLYRSIPWDSFPSRPRSVDGT